MQIYIPPVKWLLLAVATLAAMFLFGSPDVLGGAAVLMVTDSFPDDLMTPDEAAVDLGVQPATLASWRSTGYGPDFWKWGRVIRYSRQVNADWKAQGRRSPRAAGRHP
jgi:hypothetical protein